MGRRYRSGACGVSIAALLFALALMMSGCGPKQADSGLSGGGSASLRTPANWRSAWRHALDSTGGAHEDGFVGIPTPGAPTAAFVFGLPRYAAGERRSDIEFFEQARADLRRRVVELAEAEIARANADMEHTAAIRVESLRRELEAYNERQLAETRARMAEDPAAGARNADAPGLERSLNLRLKIAALKSRLGMFGGAMNAQTESRLAHFQSELDELDKRRAESVQSAREAEATKLSDLERRLKEEEEARIAELRKSLDDRANDNIRARKSRLVADLAQGAVWEDPAEPASGFDTGYVDAWARMLAVHQKAAGAAERGFERDIAAARAMTRSRRSEIGRRDAEDSAQTNRRLAGGA